MSAKYCNVALPVPLRTLFTYSIPANLRDSLQPGSRVVVPFRNKLLVGVVVDLTDAAPPNTQIRPITKSLDFNAALPPKLIELAQWLAGYYIAPIGEVFRSMLPPVTELKTERQIAITDTGRDALNAARSIQASPRCHPDSGLRATDREVFNVIKSLTAQDLVFLEELSTESPIPFARHARLDLHAAAVARLQRRNLIEIRETVLTRHRKTQRIVAWKSTDSIAQPASSLDEKESRVRALLETKRGALPLWQLLELAKVSRSVVDRMQKGGFLESWEETIDPAEDPLDAGYTPPAHELNASQESAMLAIRSRFQLGEFGTLLLHGVTGSGKTEVYLRAIQETLARGKTAIILVPEIALTLWIGRQCRAWFGARFEGVAVLHSALSDVERAREWWRVRHGEARVVVGTRSAVFAPLQNLGLMIVDEEQETSYKQEETPKYHGRDAAIIRAKLENAVALLGSATPSLLF